MISTIKVQNYKSIRDQTIMLNGVNILIGQNGAGKSNFISLFRFLERVSEQGLQSHIFQNGGVNGFLFNGYEESKEIRIRLQFPQGITNPYLNLYDLKIESNGEQVRIADEAIGYWNKSEYPDPRMWNLSAQKHNESILKQVTKGGQEGTTAKYVYRYLTDLRVYHFHDTSENAKSKLPQPMDEVYHLESEAENLAPLLLHFRENHSKEYFKIVETVRLIYPLFEDFVLEESPQARGKVLLRWREKTSNHIFSAKQISDGTLRFICLATVLIQPPDSNYVPNTIILDEPELGLHPFAIRVLSDLIYGTSQNKQVIIATQSTNLINTANVDDVLVVERDNSGASTFKRLESGAYDQWLEDYSLGELWENNLLGGRP